MKGHAKKPDAGAFRKPTIPPSSRQAVLYARFSPRPGEEECESNDRQHERMTEWCRARGYSVRAAFSDAAVSGADHDRPGLWDAVAALQPGDVLLCDRLDRLAREVYLFAVIERTVAKRRARVVSCSGEGTDNPGLEGKLVQQIMAALAEYQRGTIRARIKAGLRRHRNAGRYFGPKNRPPYGFTVDDSHNLIPNDREQEILRTIWAQKGACRWAEIAQTLNDMGHVQRNGEKWNSKTVFDLRYKMEKSGRKPLNWVDSQDILSVESPA